MSRLEKQRKKYFLKNFIIIIIFLTLFLFFFLNLGLGLIINSATLIASLFNKKNQPLNTNNEISKKIALIDITDIPTATNSSQFYFSGTSINLDKLEFYLNDLKIKEIKITSDFFQELVGNLKKGNNTFYIIGKNEKDKILKKTSTFNIFFKPDKPKLEIKEPNDNLITTQPEIKIIGQTDKETFVKINDNPIVVDALGNFLSTIKLNQGENKIKINAEDQAGNIEEKIITVFYQKEED